MNKRLNYAYIGVDVHKEQHTAVIINCWTELFGKITFSSRISDYPEAVEKIKAMIPEDLTLLFGLEDVGGNGRSLAVYLKERGFSVKEVNPAYSSAERRNNPTTMKSDEWDARCIAEVLIKKYDVLPEAKPDDLYWTIRQYVYIRDALVKAQTTTKIQLQEQLVKTYTSYKKMFSQIDGKTALAFWEKYPSQFTLIGISAIELRDFLLNVSNNACSLKKAEQILVIVEEDGDTYREYQRDRDELVRSHIRSLRFYKDEMDKLERTMKELISRLDYKLETMPGISTVTAAQLIPEIGDINRFSNADKLAKYAGISPVFFSSAGKGKDTKGKQGNRNLNGVFYFLAVQQVQISKGSKMLRNPILYGYYERKISEGKTKSQALICIQRRLVNIIYGMMKSKTAYRMAYKEDGKKVS